MIAAVDRALALATDKTKIIPGHGPLATKSYLLAYRDLVGTLTQRINDLRQADRSDAEIKAAHATRDFDENYGRGVLRGDSFVDMMLTVTPGSRSPAARSA